MPPWYLPGKMGSVTTDAGDFTSWLRAMVTALRGDAESDVPCGTCTACCRSAQFVHIGPDEVDTLAHIPAQLLFAAPRLPRGHLVMGYDDRGCCPMLRDSPDSAGGCSIYAHRPQACRVYDCRVFAATGVVPDQPLVAERAEQWVFRAGEEDRRAVRAAAAFLADHPELLPTDSPAAQRAIAAIEVHDLFRSDATPAVDDVRRQLRAARDPNPPQQQHSPARSSRRR